MAVITSFPMIAGVQGHVTIGDGNAGNAPLPDTNITLNVSAGPTGLTATVDPTGGFFLNATAPGTATIQGTYHNGSVSILMPVLPIAVTAAVAPVYLSP